MDDVLLQAYYARVALTGILGAACLIALNLSVSAMKQAVAAKRSNLEITFLGVFEAKSGTIAGGAVLVALLLCAATIRSIPDLELPNGTKITWKYDGSKIEVNSHPLVTNKPHGNVDAAAIKESFVNAYKAHGNSLFLSGKQASSKSIDIDVSQEGESFTVTTSSERGDQRIEIQYRLEQSGDNLIFTPKELRATDASSLHP